YEIHKIGNFQFNLTTDYPFAFDTPAPAISYGSLEDYYKVGMMPQLIDNNVKKGFIWREISKKEREKIKNILEEYERKENDK
ncbi:MAG: hypothetical protein Q4C75_06320, partial [Bergeyella zoohelcum]|nr:hypothetical protein [Bergeyella zoohelcum]